MTVHNLLALPVISLTLLGLSAFMLAAYMAVFLAGYCFF
jgi:hypothetical protein